jgi:glucose/arabinose dehydrogenase
MLARMRWLSSILFVVAACGGKNEAKEDGPRPPDGPSDGPATPDAPVLPACANPVSGTTITTRQVEGVGGGGAMLVTAPAGDPKLYVVTKNGQIRIIDETETLLPEAFIDLSDDNGGPVFSSGEAGLLGLAFHPQYHVNRLFYVFYTQQVGGQANPFRDVVARCRRDAADPNKAEPTCTEILSIPDPASNHNGGMIEFGSDGFLYISTGDGGPQNDPAGNGQSLMDGSPTADSIALLGKMLRIDVDAPSNGKEYGIPATNPFASGGGAPEIFMIGFRNPWRWSFDRANGDIWIGDVGQITVEEIHHVKGSEAAGKNFGWDTYDGNTCFTLRTPSNAACEPANFVFPVDERTHTSIGNGGDGFNAIIGGQVYRGTCYPDIVGTYFYTDNGRGGLSKAVLNPDGATITKTDLPGTFPSGPASIHASATGELYLTTTSGDVHHIEAGP